MVTHKRHRRFICQFIYALALFAVAPSAFAATLSLSPSTGVYAAGQTFTANVLVNTGGTNINAAEGTLNFKPTELSVLGVSKGSIFNLWTSEPSFSNTAGTISFSGGSPTGYNGSGGSVISVTFKAKAAGNPKVNFGNGSVLAADGRGTNVLTGMNGASYTISAQTTTPQAETIIEYVAPANTPGAPQVTSSTHADQAQWYKASVAKLSWSIPSGVTAVRTLLDSKNGSIPTKVYDTPIRDITLDDLAQGVQYFHVQFKNADGWGKITHYRLAVDSVAPTLLDVSVPEGADLSNPLLVLNVKSEDATSPVRTFKVQIDGAEPFDYTDEHGSSTLPLPSLLPGYHTVVIEAFDAAGNSIIDSLSFTILAFDKPVFTDVPTTINEGVIPVFKGTTRVNADVAVTMVRLGTEPVTVTVKSDAQGTFIFIPDAKLSEGVYELTARATDAYGAQSDVSDPVRVAVEKPGFIRIGSFLVSVLSVLVPLMLLLGFMVLAALYFFRKVRTVKIGVAREAHEAEAILNREFITLQQSLVRAADTLKAGRKTGKLTKVETDFLDSFAAALHTAQKTIVKEIVDVEDIVD